MYVPKLSISSEIVDIPRDFLHTNMHDKGFDLYSVLDSIIVAVLKRKNGKIIEGTPAQAS